MTTKAIMPGNDRLNQLAKGPRYARRVDANQADIISALQKIGCTVLVIGEPVDLLVGYRKRNWLFEVKDGTLIPSERKLNDHQVNFFAEWHGQVDKVESVAQALEIVTGQIA